MPLALSIIEEGEEGRGRVTGVALVDETDGASNELAEEKLPELSSDLENAGPPSRKLKSREPSAPLWGPENSADGAKLRACSERGVG